MADSADDCLVALGYQLDEIRKAKQLVANKADLNELIDEIEYQREIQAHSQDKNAAAPVSSDSIFHFEYKYDMDTNGIVFQIATRLGTAPWQNRE